MQLLALSSVEARQAVAILTQGIECNNKQHGVHRDEEANS
jgi:hypothetical protein